VTKTDEILGSKSGWLHILGGAEKRKRGSKSEIPTYLKGYDENDEKPGAGNCYIFVKGMQSILTIWRGRHLRGLMGIWAKLVSFILRKSVIRQRVVRGLEENRAIYHVILLVIMGFGNKL